MQSIFGMTTHVRGGIYGARFSALCSAASLVLIEKTCLFFIAASARCPHGEFARVHTKGSVVLASASPSLSHQQSTVAFSLLLVHASRYGRYFASLSESRRKPTARPNSPAGHCVCVCFCFRRMAGRQKAGTAAKDPAARTCWTSRARRASSSSLLRSGSCAPSCT